jgi:alpha-2-macroglobulin-like protein
MKTGKNIAVLIIAVIALVTFGFKMMNGDDPFITRLSASITHYFKNKPLEKIYLHIDKPFYKPGEDIWFKAYLTDGTTNTASGNSDVVYVELINPRGNTETTLTLQAIQGSCFGNFSLGESAPGGIYKIKAYTRYMQNFGKDYFFEKEIQVQKIVFPRLLTKFDFEKKSYGAGDTVVANVTMETLGNVPLSFKEVTADVSLDGNKYQIFTLKTGNKGNAKVSFVLPADLNTSDGLVNLKVTNEGNVEAISRSIPIVLNKISLQFFPEGGYAVEGVSCRMAFKATNEFGKAADIQGYVVDDRQARIVSFASFHQGMGAFSIVPESGRRYYAIITQPAKSKPVELPAPMEKGYTLGVDKKDDGNYQVCFNSPLAGTVHLVIQSGRSIAYSKTMEASKGRNVIGFSAKKFPTGIGLLTLFDANEIPRSERLVFFNYNRRLHVSLKFDKEKYAPREKITLHLRTLDEDSIPIPANLSLSVVNDQLYTFADDKQHNILSWLLAGSELKGKIEEPDFYFKTTEPKAEEALDYLLMTQGWRRYTWDDVLKQNDDVAFRPEKIGCVSGRIILKKTGEPVKAEMTIMEMQNRRRILRVNTDAAGRFTFLDADASSSLQLLARAEKINPLDISIEINHLNDISGTKENALIQQNNLIPEVIKVQAMDLKAKNKDKGNMVILREERPMEKEEAMVMKEDRAQLDEVVVVGYGVQKKSALTGSIASITPNELNRNSIQNIGQALQGKVAGIAVINSTGEPGTVSHIRIRGASSVSDQNPLCIIDGVVFDQNLSGKPSPLQMIDPQSIESITILKDANSTAIYGSRGANGVILIDTKNRSGSYQTIRKTFKPKYAGLLISPRQLSVTKEFYYPVYKDEEIPETRTDFRSTIYWNPNIQTDHAGEATIEFYNSDEITTFRAIAEGIGKNGCVGHEEKKFITELPFSMAVKFPAYLTFGDTVNMPLILKNNTSRVIDGDINMTLPESLSAMQEIPTTLHIEPNSSLSLSVPLVVKSMAGKSTLRVSFKSETFKDAFTQEVEIQPKGFPTTFSISGKDKEKQFAFVINKSVAGSAKAVFTAFPDMLTDLMSGVESILREPYGCFEQTSSSTYPNIMVLQYLKETETADEATMKKAYDLIKKGYERLTGFETNEKGYEWFGRAPAHEGLTAYGIMEFTDMKGVYKQVDNEMIRRTLKFILDKRDGKGNFEQSSQALDAFGRASEAVNNAYIIYALSEAGIDEVEKEYKKARQEALTSGDPYRMALLANAAFNLKKTDDGMELLTKIKNIKGDKSWDAVKIDHSITRSYGKSLSVESASLYTLALLKAPAHDWTEVAQTINYLVNSRSNGGFGSTQATILALKAMKEYAKMAKQTSESGKIVITINGKEAAVHSYEKDAKGKILIENLESFLQEGENMVAVRFKETKSPLSFSFDAHWNSLTPASSPECKVRLLTSLSATSTKVGETVRLTAKINNITNEGLPMTIAIVGIPSGLSLQPWQLKEMTEQGKIDFYEVVKNYLVIYYRQMKPHQVHELHFDLKSEIRGSYQALAGSAYLYYTNEFKDWQDGGEIRVE